MSPDNVRRLLAACGLLAVVLILPAFVLVNPAPAVTASAAGIASYYRAAGQPFLVYGWLTGLSVPLVLTHIVGVGAWLRERRETRGLSLLYLLTGASSQTMQLILLAIFQTARFAASDGNAAGAKLLSDLGNVGFAFYAVIAGGWLVVATVAVFRTAVPSWLGVLTAANAVLCLLGSLGTFASGSLAAGRLLVVAWYLVFLAVFSVFNVWLLTVRSAWSGMGAPVSPAREVSAVDA
jgi:hypothetical protein